jgi:hypothetical protein
VVWGVDDAGDWIIDGTAATWTEQERRADSSEHRCAHTGPTSFEPLHLLLFMGVPIDVRYVRNITLLDTMGSQISCHSNRKVLLMQDQHSSAIRSVILQRAV